MKMKNTIIIVMVICAAIAAQESADVPSTITDSAGLATVNTPTAPAPAPPATATLPSMSAPHRLTFKGPVHNLSLQDALQRSIQDNPLVKIERINTHAALSLVRDQELVFEPRLSAGYSTRARDGTRYQAGSPFKDNHDLSVAVTGDLPTGTGVEAGIGASPYSSTRFPEGRYQNTVGLTVTQSLLQGLGTSANLVPLRKARLDVDIRREELAAYAQRMIADVERAYWDLLFSGEQMNIYKYSLELAERLLYETEERLKIGSVAPIELVALRAEAASRERQLYDAEVAYRQKALYLIYIMNTPDLWDAELVLSDTAAALGKADAVGDHIDAAHKFRPDYRQAFMQAQKGELDLLQTKNGALPRLDFFVSLSGATPFETFPRALLPGGDMSGMVAGGLNFSIPVTNAAPRERHRRARFSVEQQKLAIENYARLIEYEIRTAHMEVERAHRQVETAAAVSALQLQKLEAEQRRMEAGRSTGYAVLQVQRDVVAARLDEAQARTAYIGALITLFSKDGTLLQRRGISMDNR